MKQQFVLSHTIRQTGIPALLDSWVTNTHFVNSCVHEKIARPYIFIKM
jgi:hypothetical protein